MMVVWKIRGKTVRTVVSRVVYDSCAQWHAQCTHLWAVLKVAGGLGLGLLPLPRRILYVRVVIVVCQFICLLATLHKNFWMDLHEIFREGWQWNSEQMVKFWWRFRSRIRIRIQVRIWIHIVTVTRALLECIVPVLLVFCFFFCFNLHCFSC